MLARAWTFPHCWSLDSPMKITLVLTVLCVSQTGKHAVDLAREGGYGEVVEALTMSKSSLWESLFGHPMCLASHVLLFC